MTAKGGAETRKRRNGGDAPPLLEVTNKDKWNREQRDKRTKYKSTGKE
jgi:hypothetical protein